MEAVERISQANDIVIDVLSELFALLEDVWKCVIPDQPGVVDDGSEGIEDLSLRGDEFIEFFLGER